MNYAVEISSATIISYQVSLSFGQPYKVDREGYTDIQTAR
jgi:hypothetical protein